MNINTLISMYSSFSNTINCSTCPRKGHGDSNTYVIACDENGRDCRNCVLDRHKHQAILDSVLELKTYDIN